MEPELRCPKCGGTYFTRWESGNYTERHSIDIQTMNEDWDDQNTDVMDSTEWECRPCDLILPDWMQEAIEEVR